jgi:hypothetical protein
MLATVTRAVDPLIALIFMGIVTILTTDILLIRQLSKLVTAALKPDQAVRSQQTIAAEPPPQFSRVDTAPFLPASSVTENTTRFLENEYRAPVEPPPGEKQNS